MRRTESDHTHRPAGFDWNGATGRSWIDNGTPANTHYDAYSFLNRGCVS